MKHKKDVKKGSEISSNHGNATEPSSDIGMGSVDPVVPQTSALEGHVTTNNTNMTEMPEFRKESFLSQQEGTLPVSEISQGSRRIPLPGQPLLGVSDRPQQLSLSHQLLPGSDGLAVVGPNRIVSTGVNNLVNQSKAGISGLVADPSQSQGVTNNSNNEQTPVQHVKDNSMVSSMNNSTESVPLQNELTVDTSLVNTDDATGTIGGSLGDDHVAVVSPGTLAGYEECIDRVIDRVRREIMEMKMTTATETMETNVQKEQEAQQSSVGKSSLRF